MVKYRDFLFTKVPYHDKKTDLDLCFIFDNFFGLFVKVVLSL